MKTKTTVQKSFQKPPRPIQIILEKTWVDTILLIDEFLPYFGFIPIENSCPFKMS